MLQQPRELSREDFEATFLPPMVDISKSATELVDLWAYADRVIAASYHDCTSWHWRVAHIYESRDGRYQHIGIPVPKDDTYLTVVVDVAARGVLGHYVLDLGAMYSGGDEAADGVAVHPKAERPNPGLWRRLTQRCTGRRPRR